MRVVNGLRPTIPSTTPENFSELIQQCWSSEPADRPDCESVLKRLVEMQNDYLSNTSKWDRSKE